MELSCPPSAHVSKKTAKKEEKEEDDGDGGVDDTQDDKQCDILQKVVRNMDSGVRVLGIQFCFFASSMAVFGHAL